MEKEKIRLIRCNECKTNFSERKGAVLSQSRLNQDKVVQILDHHQDGCGTRSTGRLVKVSTTIVTRYTKISGKVAEVYGHEIIPKKKPSPGRPPKIYKGDIIIENK